MSCRGGASPASLVLRDLYGRQVGEEVAQGSLHYSTLFAIGIVLFVISFAINSLAGRLVGVDGVRRSRGGML